MERYKFKPPETSKEMDVGINGALIKKKKKVL